MMRFGYKNLSCIKLWGANLSRTNLTGAGLSKTNLWGANLSKEEIKRHLNRFIRLNILTKGRKGN